MTSGFSTQFLTAVGLLIAAGYLLEGGHRTRSSCWASRARC